MVENSHSGRADMLPRHAFWYTSYMNSMFTRPDSHCFNNYLFFVWSPTTLQVPVIQFSSSFISLVLSKLYYSCLVYSSANPAHLWLLDPIHHAGVWLVTGTFQSRPIPSLLVDAGVLLLDLHRQSVIARFGLDHRAFQAVRPAPFCQIPPLIMFFWLIQDTHNLSVSEEGRFIVCGSCPFLKKMTHTHLTYSYLMSRGVQSYCDDCWVPLTQWHLLVKCLSLRDLWMIFSTLSGRRQKFSSLDTGRCVYLGHETFFFRLWNILLLYYSNFALFLPSYP